MISNRTSNEITLILQIWCEAHRIGEQSVLHLLQSLSLVRSNQSYQDSIKGLTILWEEHLKKESNA